MREELTLADVCAQLVDCVNRTAPEVEDGEFYAVGTPAMRGNTIDFSEARRISAETFRRWTRRLVPIEGDLLLAREAPVGPVVRIPACGKIAAGQRTMHLRAEKSRVHDRYLFYLLTSPHVQRRLMTLAMGSTVPHLRVTDVKSFALPPLPSLDYQQAVANMLGALDDKIAANEHTMSVARDLSNAHFSKLLALQNSPASTIGELANRRALEFGDGYRTKRSEHGTPGIRILRAGDVRGFRMFANGPDYVSEKYRVQIGGKKSKSGDIVLTTKGTVGRVAIVPPYLEEVVYSPQMCYFRVVDETVVNFGFLAAWFRSKDLIDQLSTVMHKSDMAPYVNLQDVASLRVPMPDMPVQRAEGTFQRSMVESVHALSRENEVLSRTRDELLPLLMSGRIRVRHAEKVVEEVI